MDLNDLTEITTMAELLRARCEAAGAPYTSMRFEPGGDLVIHVTGSAATRELIRLGAEPTGDWRISTADASVALRGYRLGVFTMLDSRDLRECDLIPAVIVPRADVVPA